MYGLIPRGESRRLLAPRGPTKWPDGDVVCGLRMTDKHARAIPQLEAFEKMLAR